MLILTQRRAAVLKVTGSTPVPASYEDLEHSFFLVYSDISFRGLGLPRGRGRRGILISEDSHSSLESQLLELDISAGINSNLFQIN
jgi:hypothetical protein